MIKSRKTAKQPIIQRLLKLTIFFNATANGLSNCKYYE